MLGEVYIFLPSRYIREEESRTVDGKQAYLVKYEMKVGKLVV
jgi:hypothetical protein